MAKRRSRSKGFDLTSAPELGDKTLLYVFGFAFIVVSLANSYLLMQLTRNFEELQTDILNIKVRVPVDGIAAQPESQDQPEVSPFDQAMPLLSADTQAMIQKYQVTGTPTLILNCNKKRVGTYALAEEGGNLPLGSEIEEFSRSLCQMAGEESVFCTGLNQIVLAGLDAKLEEARAELPEGMEPGIQIETTSDSPCGSAETIIIYAFHSPSCPYSTAQQAVLARMQERFPGALVITDVCTPIHGTDDVAQCKTAGTYGMI